jgi:hypothetical protein
VQRIPPEFATIKPANSQAVLRTIVGGGRPGVIKSLRAYYYWKIRVDTVSVANPSIGLELQGASSYESPE